MTAKKKITKKKAAKPAPRKPVEPVPFRPVPGAQLSRPKPDAAPSVFTQITHPKKRAYFEALSTTPSFTEAARLAGISRKTGFTYRNEANEKTRALLDLALQMGIRRAEDEAWRRGTEGWEEPVYQGGKLVGTKLVKSDTMLIFMLKAAKPEKYRERFEHSGPAGGPIQTEDLTGLSDAELAKRTKRLVEAFTYGGRHKA